ncbi:hypothetical protein AN958_05301 [Leucoagaricus sp. SymC.cos]|nr:hypothetical protein AN958_05301 [Leucoagaricus sp. SymC.cos]
MFIHRAFCSSARRFSQRSEEEIEAYKRRRQAEWKRKQGGNTFLDHLIVTVRGGKGGDGCAAFHREKFKPFGPPSGGNGGRGGSVYFLPTPALTTLSTVPSRIRGHNGQHGKGTWQNGKAGEPLVIKIPVGTVVRELGRKDPRRARDEWESEEEAMVAEGLTTAERIERMREKRWLHYPGYGESNIERDDFKEVEASMYKLERERRLARRRRLDENPIFLDLDKEADPTSSTEADNAPLGIRQPEYLGHLIAKGGQGGLGNPTFVSTSNRTPRYATRGHEGERVTLFLELKLLADIGLVGMPNAGKSTLLRALTGGRAKTDVAGYAFTTLNPVVGIVQSRPTRAGHHFDLYENFRFTIADNPGLIENSASPFAHAGLGHSFLRAIERSPALVYVVDFSIDVDPCEAIRILKTELDTYQEGMASRIRMVVANKADLVASQSPSSDTSSPSAEAIEEAKGRLARLEEFVRTELGEDVIVIPVSAKYRMNLRKVVALMKGYVEEAREEKLAAREAAEAA